jgi:hypothetical protein
MLTGCIAQPAKPTSRASGKARDAAGLFLCKDIPQRRTLLGSDAEFRGIAF